MKHNCNMLGAMPTLAWACRSRDGMATQAWPWHPIPGGAA